jgi:hypothetical protein
MEQAECSHQRKAASTACFRLIGGLPRDLLEVRGASEAEQPIEQPKDRSGTDAHTRRRTLVRQGGYTLDFLPATRNA